MPMIQLYVDNNTHVDFIQLEPADNKEARSIMIKELKDFIKDKKGEND